MIPESFIEELKYSSDIEQVISSYVSLKQRGRRLSGLCPFHSEKTPSFTVYPESQSYYCFGCGSGGDVITFIRNIENLEYVEALRFLAGKAGMRLPEDALDDKAAGLKARILEINRETARFFHDLLISEDGRTALEYLKGRGLRMKTIRTFGLGFSPAGWDGLLGHLRSKGYGLDEMRAAAVITERRSGGYYDMFRGRVMFPIIDLRGGVIGFGGRSMDEKGPKYLNSPDTPVFKKSRNLFALNFAKASKSDNLILGEGYMDVIAMHQAGFTNAVATLGTSLTEEQARLISQYAKRVVIAYDSDSAGQAATKRAINLFSETGVSVGVLEIRDAKDPDEYIRKFGKERFEHLISTGKGALDFEIGRLREKHEISTAEGTVAFLNDFCKLMAGIDNDLERNVYIGSIARQLDVDKQGLVSSVEALRKRQIAKKLKKATHNLQVYAQDNAGGRMRPRNSGNLEGLVAEEKLLTLLMKNPDYYEDVKDGLSPEDFKSDDNRAIFSAIAGKLDNHQSPELIYLSRSLTPDQTSRLSGMLAKGLELQFTRGQASEYMRAIKAQKEKRTEDEVRGMSAAEYEKYITSLKAGKK